MAKKKQNDERLVQVMVRRGRTVVGGGQGVKVNYSPGDIMEVPVDEARRLEKLNAVEILEDL